MIPLNTKMYFLSKNSLEQKKENFKKKNTKYVISFVRILHISNGIEN